RHGADASRYRGGEIDGAGCGREVGEAAVGVSVTVAPKRHPRVSAIALVAGGARSCAPRRMGRMLRVAILRGSPKRLAPQDDVGFAAAANHSTALSCSTGRYPAPNARSVDGGVSSMAPASALRISR